jgi:hypothetical protein
MDGERSGTSYKRSRARHSRLKTSRLSSMCIECSSGHFTA